MVKLKEGFISRQYSTNAAYNSVFLLYQFSGIKSGINPVRLFTKGYI